MFSLSRTLLSDLGFAAAAVEVATGSGNGLEVEAEVTVAVALPVAADGMLGREEFWATRCGGTTGA